MPLKVTGYLPPGSYIAEEVVQPIPAFIGLPRQICLIGEGDECKTVVNEAHLRAYITQEAVTPATSAPNFFIPVKQTDSKKSNMSLFKNGDEQAAAAFSIVEVTVGSAPTVGAATAGGAVDAGSHTYKVTFVLPAGETNGGPASLTATTSAGNLTVPLSAIPLGPTGTTARKVYRNKLAVPGTWFLVTTITGNSTTTYNDIKADTALTDTIPTASTGITKVTVTASDYDSTADFTFSYQSLASLNDKDTLTEDVKADDSDCGTILAVGLFPGTHNFVKGTDYQLANTGLDNAIQWLPPAEAEITGSAVEGGGFVFGVGGKTLKLTISGGSEFSVTLTGTLTAAAVATALGANTTFNAVATAEDASGHVKIITIATGPTASITIGNGTANSILGFTTSAAVVGGGANPAQGADFYVTYKAKRPDSEFNRPIVSTSFDQYIRKIGLVSTGNALALAGQIVFEQRPPFVYHVQVKNTGTGLAAQDQDYIDAIKGAELNPDLTDIIVLGHPTTNAGGKKPLVRAALRDHIIQQSSLQNKAERLGWFGLDVVAGGLDANPGDGETAGTYIYVATQELQVSADSPGRGRFVLNAPSFVKKSFRFPDGVVKQLTLDATFLAAGVAALECSFLSPAEGLLRKEVVGFDAVEELSRGTRDLLAQNGINVVQPRGGVNVCFDPTTTDQSSAEFKEINVMAQKDNIVKRVRKATDDALIGIVPDDLAQFVFELKTVVAVQLTSAVAEGAIAKFQNNDGTERNIDLRNDIIVKRRLNDPTAYDFNFVFYARFIVKRLFGTFSVVIPSGV